MTFKTRNKRHELLMKQLFDDAELHHYSVQSIGNETLKMPIAARHTDKTSWMVRATPDVLALGCRAVLLELKTKLNERTNIAIELKPLEIYQEKTEDIFIVAETFLDGGLDSCRVVHANDIHINRIDIPNRIDNKSEEIERKYPLAHIRHLPSTSGGSGTPYILLSPNKFKKWMPWDVFRDVILLRKNDDWFVSRDIGKQDTII